MAAVEPEFGIGLAGEVADRSTCEALQATRPAGVTDPLGDGLFGPLQDRRASGSRTGIEHLMGAQKARRRQVPDLGLVLEDQSAMLHVGIIVPAPDIGWCADLLRFIENGRLGDGALVCDDRRDPELADAGLDAMAFAGRIMRGVWCDERNAADPDYLREAAAAVGIDGAAVLKAAESAATAARYQELTEEAKAVSVFGSPFYVIDGEPFWGQDRLELVRDVLLGGFETIPEPA